MLWAGDLRLHTPTRRLHCCAVVRCASKPGVNKLLQELRGLAVCGAHSAHGAILKYRIPAAITRSQLGGAPSRMLQPPSMPCTSVRPATITCDANQGRAHTCNLC